MSTIRWSPITSIKNNQAPGTIICGMPGSGKTFFMQQVAADALGMGQRVIVIDPKNDFRHLLNIYPDISIIDIQDVHPNALNPFTFLQKVDKNGETIYINDIILLTLIQILIGNIDQKTYNAIQPIVSDYIKLQSRKNVFNDMLSIAEYLFSKDSTEARFVGSQLKSFESSAFGKLLFTKEKNVKPLILSNNSSLIISLFGLKMPNHKTDVQNYTAEERFTSAILYLLTSKLQDILTQDSRIPTIFICDEAHTLFCNQELSNIIDKFLLQGRSLNIATVLASQGISHFPDDIANTMTTKFLFKSSLDEAEAFIKLFDSSKYDARNALDVESIVTSINRFNKPGQVFMIDSQNRNGIIQISEKYDPKLLSSNPYEKKRDKKDE